MKVHPAADVFPMLPEEELQQLAADIKANGLREALKVSGGLLIDGRNRLAACKIVGLEPRTEELNGTDPVAYIFSVNVKRRHMNKGQQAMAVAMIYPEPEKGGRGKKGILNIQFSKQSLSHARQVISVLPELAKRVLNGVVPLNEAYETAIRERASAEAAEVLRKEAPDLAQQVDDGRPLSGALAAFEQRKREQQEGIKNQRETVIRLAADAYNSTVAWSVESFWKRANESLADREFRTAFLSRVRIDPSNLGEIQKGARIFARLLTKLTK